MGRVIASKLAADGFDVAVAYVADIDLADATVGEIVGHGRRGAAFTADIANEEAVSALFDAVDDHFGRLDVVVHTAGINRSADLTDLDLADFDAIHRVNVRGTFVVDQQAARRVRCCHFRGWGAAGRSARDSVLPRRAGPVFFLWCLPCLAGAVGHAVGATFVVSASELDRPPDDESAA